MLPFDMTKIKLKEECDLKQVVFIEFGCITTTPTYLIKTYLMTSINILIKTNMQH